MNEQDSPANLRFGFSYRCQYVSLKDNDPVTIFCLKYLQDNQLNKTQNDSLLCKTTNHGQNDVSLTRIS